MNKTIVLGLPKSFSFHTNLETNLRALGFTVVNISYTDHDFKYPSFFHKIYNFLRKVFLKDKGYKNKLKIKKYEADLRILLETHKTYDYALLIRPDIYPLGILELIREKTTLMVGYQWDGLHRFPAVYATIKYFDRFFVFDEADLSYDSKLLPITNFYFDFDKEPASQSPRYSVFFVGSFVRKRMAAISGFASLLREKGLTPKIMIYCQPAFLATEFPNENIEYIFAHLSYEENIKILKDSKVVIDFLNHAHKGLSFRTFEALYYNKKLITTNADVQRYDFYNPNNIFIWDETNSSAADLLAFMDTPYEEVAENIKAKYAFTNWISYVLDRAPYEKIELTAN